MATTNNIILHRQYIRVTTIKNEIIHFTCTKSPFWYSNVLSWFSQCSLKQNSRKHEAKPATLFFVRQTSIVRKWKDVSSDMHRVLMVYNGCLQLIRSVVLETNLNTLTNFVSFTIDRPLTSGNPTSTNKVKILVCFSWKGSCLMQWSVKAAITLCHCAEEFKDRRISAMELAQSRPTRLESKSSLY